MTLARLLKVSIGVLLLGAAAWLLAWWHLGWPLLAIVGTCGILLVHAPVLAFEFVLAHHHNIRSATPGASCAELCRAWFAEAMGAVVVFGWHQPFWSMRYRDRWWAPSVGQRGLILIHGFICNRGIWNPWWARLMTHQAPVVALSLEPVFASIDHYAQQIDAAVRRVTALTGQPPLLVAHSMGGLAVRAWLRQFEAESRVYRVLTVATPHRGTWLAYFGLGPNGSQMRYASPWLRRLLEAEPSTTQAKFICYYSHCDNIVFPVESATLPNADNRHVRGFGHVHLLRHPEILDEVMRLLKE